MVCDRSIRNVLSGSSILPVFRIRIRIRTGPHKYIPPWSGYAKKLMQIRNTAFYFQLSFTEGKKDCKIFLTLQKLI